MEAGSSGLRLGFDPHSQEAHHASHPVLHFPIRTVEIVTLEGEQVKTLTRALGAAISHRTQMWNVLQDSAV